MSADRDITPRVIAHLRAALPDVDIGHRVSPLVAQVVLRQLARWARRGGDAGQWTTTESVSQIEVGTGVPPRTIRKALHCLEAVGLVATIRHGGGQGITARGSTRLLMLDPAGSTKAGNRPEFRPATKAGTARTEAGTASTKAGQQAYTASSSASSSTRKRDDSSPIHPLVLAAMQRQGVTP